MSVKLTIVAANNEDVFHDMARVDVKHRPGTKAGQIVKVTIGNKNAFLVARGAPSRQKNSLSLDSATRTKLGVSKNNEYDVDISPAGFFGQLNWAWQATDAMPRIAARLAVLSVILGLVGFALGLISICISIFGRNP